MICFKDGKIKDIIIKDMTKNEDDRGWLIELFRNDMIEKEKLPAMSYISLTYSGITRGPHEHSEQTDYFCFIGFSSFRLILWDNRKESSTYMSRMILDVSEHELKIVIIPPGVVHAYKNTGNKNGIIINFPDKLYAGRNKNKKVDEIRYENNHDNPFKVE